MKNIWKLSILSMLSISVLSCQSPTNTGTSASPSAGTSATPNPGASVQPSANAGTSTGLSFSYVGIDSDKVSAGNNIIPDKANDLHFTATYNFAGESQIILIVISKYENGKPNRSIGWAAGTALNWVVGVEANGKALNTTKLRFDNNLSGNVKFDFYGSDLPGYGLTTKGTSYQLDITYKDGSGKETLISQVTTL